jgi:uncharacterized membrane protein YphA (DoxX/SURF4 family)
VVRGLNGCAGGRCSTQVEGGFRLPSAEDITPSGDDDTAEPVTAEQRKQVLEDIQHWLNLQQSRASRANESESEAHYALQFAVAWGELLGGAALLIGLWTRLSAVALLLVQAGVLVALGWIGGLSFDAGDGAAYNVAVFVLCLALMAAGAGPLSADAWLGRLGRRVPKASAETAAATGPSAETVPSVA